MALKSVGGCYESKEGLRKAKKFANVTEKVGRIGCYISMGTMLVGSAMFAKTGKKCWLNTIAAAAASEVGFIGIQSLGTGEQMVLDDLYYVEDDVEK